ncbi:MAG: hypothetical protein ABSG74_12535 [Candidatus Bathyarchaeia archaeon]|jgi:hypothetical protein
MRSIKLAALLIGLMVLAIGLTVVPHVNAGPVINTAWTSSPPTIDGKFTQGEWHNLQISMTSPDYPIEAYAYFMNDNSNLYVLVDAVGDKTAGASDECLLWFGFSHGYYLYDARFDVYGDGHMTGTAGYDAAAGFDVSPNSPDQHRIYEFKIPLSLINIQPGQSIEFCSPSFKGNSIVYDGKTGNDNIWPKGLDPTKEETWGILSTQAQPVSAPVGPVGGLMQPVNKLVVFAPYLALFGVIGAVAVVFWKRTDN